MNVVLITPCSENISAFGARAISSYLKTRGHTTTVITLPIIPDVYRDRTGCLYTRPYEYSEQITNQIVELAGDAGLVGISFMTQYLHCVAQLTDTLRQRTSAPVLWGGVHPTVDPAGSLEYADIVCVGEGEYAMVSELGMEGDPVLVDLVDQWGSVMQASWLGLGGCYGEHPLYFMFFENVLNPPLPPLIAVNLSSMQSTKLFCGADAMHHALPNCLKRSVAIG